MQALHNNQNILCLIADTTSLNTDSKSGIFHRIEHYLKVNYGVDVISLGCLYHINELLLHKVIKNCDGLTTSATSLAPNSVYNNIKSIKKVSTTEEKLMHYSECDISPNIHARQIL